MPVRILLVDDNAKHRRAGVSQLKARGHEVVAISSYYEAMQIARKDHFDAALIDLMMPAEADMLGEKGMAHFALEMPVGFALAMLLAHANVDAVACATDTNHHDHPMSAMVDHFHGVRLLVNQKPVRIMHARLGEDGAKNWLHLLDVLKEHPDHT